MKDNQQTQAVVEGSHTGTDLNSGSSTEDQQAEYPNKSQLRTDASGLDKRIGHAQRAPQIFVAEPARPDDPPKHIIAEQYIKEAPHVLDDRTQTGLSPWDRTPGVLPFGVSRGDPPSAWLADFILNNTYATDNPIRYGLVPTKPPASTTGTPYGPGASASGPSNAHIASSEAHWKQSVDEEDDLGPTDDSDTEDDTMELKNDDTDGESDFRGDCTNDEADMKR